MTHLEISGASDDLVEIAGDDSDEFEAYRGWSGRVLAGDGSGFRVAFVFDPYGGNGSWEIRVTQLDEDLPLPLDWSLSIRQSEVSYSPALIVDTPIDVAISSDGQLL